MAPRRVTDVWALDTGGEFHCVLGEGDFTEGSFVCRNTMTGTPGVFRINFRLSVIIFCL